MTKIQALMNDNNRSQKNYTQLTNTNLPLFTLNTTHYLESMWICQGIDIDYITVMSIISDWRIESKAPSTNTKYWHHHWNLTKVNKKQKQSGYFRKTLNIVPSASHGTSYPMHKIDHWFSRTTRIDTTGLDSSSNITPEQEARMKKHCCGFKESYAMQYPMTTCKCRLRTQYKYTNYSDNESNTVDIKDLYLKILSNPFIQL